MYLYKTRKLLLKINNIGVFELRENEREREQQGEGQMELYVIANVMLESCNKYTHLSNLFFASNGWMRLCIV